MVLPLLAFAIAEIAGIRTAAATVLSGGKLVEPDWDCLAWRPPSDR